MVSDNPYPSPAESLLKAVDALPAHERNSVLIWLLGPSPRTSRGAWWLRSYTQALARPPTRAAATDPRIHHRHTRPRPRHRRRGRRTTTGRAHPADQPPTQPVAPLVRPTQLHHGHRHPRPSRPVPGQPNTQPAITPSRRPARAQLDQPTPSTNQAKGGDPGAKPSLAPRPTSPRTAPKPPEQPLQNLRTRCSISPESALIEAVQAPLAGAQPATPDRTCARRRHLSKAAHPSTNPAASTNPATSTNPASQPPASSYR